VISGVCDRVWGVAKAAKSSADRAAWIARVAPRARGPVRGHRAAVITRSMARADRGVPWRGMPAIVVGATRDARGFDRARGLFTRAPL
jgi:hypothetical protein